MASVFVSTPAEVVVVDSRTRSGFITLPTTNSIPFRTINFKDQYGTFSNSSLTVSTQVGESFDDGTTSKTFSNAFTYLSLYATSSKWMVMNATQTVQQTISSLTVNQLQFGTGAGWIQFGPIQAPIVSTQQIQTNDAYNTNLYIGQLSTVNFATYWGLVGAYNNTALAEISTGGGTQELLVFRGSSASDRIRMQTTGSIVFEPGVSARLWNSNTTQTLSNATPAMIINTSSNVGIQTASPGATLDVAGTARAINMSTQQLFVSSINGAQLLVLINLTSTVQGLGSASYISTLSLVSTTSGLQTQFQTAGFLSTANLTSTVQGLGSAGYASTSYVLQQISSFSTALGSVGAGNLTTANLTSTVQGLGSASYISSSQLISTVAGIGSGSGLTQTVLTSTVIGLGTIGYISTPGGGGGVSQTVLTSTVIGLGTTGYVSTATSQSQYSLFSVRAGTSYTGEPWTEQLMSLSNIGLFNAPIYLDTDNITLRVSTTATSATFRVNYMTGGNNTTLTTPRPTITMALSTSTDVTFFPSVENFEGGGGTVSFLQTVGANDRLLFYMRGLSNYTFGSIDANLYRMSFELVGQTQVLNVLSNISSISSIIDNLYTKNTRVTTELIVDRSSITTSAFAGNLLANDANIRNSTTTFSMYSDTTRTLNSTISRAVHTDYLRVMSNAIIGCNSVVIRDDTVFASSVQVSTVNILDQSTMRFVPLSISSGSIYLNNVLASAGGGGGGSGGGGTGGSTLSSLFVGSSSNQNFIKFWGQIGEYNNTAIVQQSTGGGTTEFLFFEGSSINDQFRFQTTGNIRFETGVAGPRNVNNANQIATPTMIINSSSNVGIQTANPSFPLDVGGAGRFQTLMSTVSVFSGALYLGVFFA